jgi:enoyl-CoA hydratase/carnithine racemase
MSEGLVSDAPKDDLVIERIGSLAILVMNRPEARNAINDGLRSALTRAVQEVGDDPDVRAVVLTGNGVAFSAGGDIRAMKERLATDPGLVGGKGWLHQRRRTHMLVKALHQLEKPTIAALNGAAAGLGCDLAMACDFIVASETASLSYSYIHRGLIPDGGGMYFLPRRIGIARAREVILSGRRIEAAEAFSMGMVDRLAAQDAVRGAAVEWATQLGDAPPLAISLTNAILNQSMELSLDQALSMGSQAQAVLYSSDDHRRSVEAFLESAAARKKTP